MVQVQPQTDEIVANPRALALLIGFVGATFAIVLVLVVLMPLTAFELVSSRDIVFILVGTAIWAFSVGFLAMLLRYSRKELAEALEKLAEVNALPKPEEAVGLVVQATTLQQYDDEQGLGKDWLQLKEAHKIVRLTDGITEELLAKLAAASLPAVSQRALDSSGVVTRDPAVALNAKVLIAWLSRNDFIRLIGNSRYEFTPLGKSLLQTVGGTSSDPPPTTTVERQQ